jgi:hypothetical protein
MELRCAGNRKFSQKICQCVEAVKRTLLRCVCGLRVGSIPRGVTQATALTLVVG